MTDSITNGSVEIMDGESWLETGIVFVRVEKLLRAGSLDETDEIEGCGNQINSNTNDKKTDQLRLF